MDRKCKHCGKIFNATRNQRYCSKECREIAYKNYSYYTPETTERYREKIKEEFGFSDTDFNFEFRERTASNKGMTVSEYNTYLEERKASKLGLTVKELRHFTYLAKKNKNQLYEELGMQKEEYYIRLKN